LNDALHGVMINVASLSTVACLDLHLRNVG